MVVSEVSPERVKKQQGREEEKRMRKKPRRGKKIR